MRFIAVLLCVLASSPVGQAAISLSGASTLWTAISGNYDFLADQQTGQPQDDIVGNASNPGFFTAFDDGGTPTNTTDGFLAFRVRLNSQDGNKSSYTGYVWVGVDADTDGSVDAYIRYTGSNNGAGVSIHAPGNDLNTSPSTTSIVATAAVSFPAATYPTYSNYRATTLSDGTSTNIDPNDANTDWYISFMLPFNALVTYLGSQNPSISINENSPLRYIVATSTQANSLNQDLGAIPKSFDGALSWSQLGGFSSFMTGSGQVIPEPSSSLFAMLSGLVLLMRRRRN